MGSTQGNSERGQGLETESFSQGMPWKRFGLAGGAALFIHAVILWSLPPEWSQPVTREAPKRALELTFRGPEATGEEVDWRFVHPNPEIPSQDPGETEQFSTKDQRAAQELPLDEDRPEGPARVEGPLSDSSAVISGQYDAWPFPTSPEPPDPEEDEVFADPSDFLEDRLPPVRSSDADEALEEAEGEGVRLVEGESEEPGENPDRITIPVRDEAHDPVDDAREDAEESEEPGEEPERRRPSPRPRRQITQGPPLVTGQDQTQAPRIGRVAVEARESAFGHYMDRMQEAIVKQWHRKARETGMGVESGTSVAVEFTLLASGEVEDILIKEATTEGVMGILIIEDAIRSRAPYGEWTEEMKAIHGEQRTVKIRFHYN